MYNVKELRDKISEKITGLGVDPKFQESPAYVSALSLIDNMIGQMNMFEAAESVMVQEEQGCISFNWNSPTGEKYSMSISCATPETFRCVKTQERKPFTSTDGQIVREKNAVEQVTTIDPKSGFVTITTNGSMINNIDCPVDKCNNTTWAEKKIYTADGVMRDREYKGYSTGELTESFDRAKPNSMLYIPRQAFDFGFWHDKYDSRTLLVREKLDTARIVVDEKSKGIRYSSVAPLNQEHGLRDMNLVGGYDPYPQEVVISPLSQEEIEAMIQRESNPKVAEGLRAFAVGRDKYYYSSIDDKSFVCEGIEQTQGITK